MARRNNKSTPASDPDAAIIDSIQEEINAHDDYMATPVEEVENAVDFDPEEDLGDQLHDIPGMGSNGSNMDDGEIHVGAKHEKSARFICAGMDTAMCFIAALTGGDTFENYKKVIPPPEIGDERVEALGEMLQEYGVALPPWARFMLATGGAYMPLGAKVMKDRRANIKRKEKDAQGL